MLQRASRPLVLLPYPAAPARQVAIANGDRLVSYEDGPNRTLSVPEADAAAHKAYSVNCEWGSVKSWLESLLPGDMKPVHKGAPPPPPAAGAGAGAGACLPGRRRGC